MGRIENAMAKIQTLNTEIEQLNAEILEAERRYNIITDQYMEGIILGPVGKEQNKLHRYADKCRVKIQKNMQEIHRLKTRYGI